MRIAPLAGAAAACLALTLMAAAPAQADQLVCNVEGNTKVCTSADFANAAKPSIKVTINGKKSITYKKGKARTMTMVETIKGMPATGNCKVRTVVKVNAPGATQTVKTKWAKYHCQDLNFRVTLKKAPLYSRSIEKEVIPVTLKQHDEVRLPSGKVIKSNTLTVKFRSPYKTP